MGNGEEGLWEIVTSSDGAAQSGTWGGKRGERVGWGCRWESEVERRRFSSVLWLLALASGLVVGL